MPDAATRVALVTGGGRGIGAAIARRLADDGHRVAVAARTGGEVDEVAAAIGGVPVVVDVADPASVAAAVAHVEHVLGGVDLLVNNAGVGGPEGTSVDAPIDAWWRTFEVNVLGAYLACRAVLPGMLARRRGRIVNVGSNAAFFPLDESVVGVVGSAYMASKAALARLGEALANETRGDGLAVFTISPGTVRTAMTVTLAEAWNDPEIWSPPDHAAELVAAIATGELDGLSGRYLHAVLDDWRALAADAAQVVARDLHAIRLVTKQAPSG